LLANHQADGRGAPGAAHRLRHCRCRPTGSESIPEARHWYIGDGTKEGNKNDKRTRKLAYEEILMRCGTANLEKRRTRET